MKLCAVRTGQASVMLHGGGTVAGHIRIRVVSIFLYTMLGVGSAGAQNTVGGHMGFCFPDSQYYGRPNHNDQP